MNNSLIATAVFTTLITTGCAMTPIAHNVNRDIKKQEKEVASTFNSAFEKVAPPRKNFKQSNAIYVNPNPLPTYIASKKPLPKFFENKLSVTNPAPLPVNELINDLSREFFEKYKQQLRINVAPDVFNPEAGIGTLIEGSGNSGTKTTGSGAATGPTINGLTSAQIQGVLIDSFVFDGSLEAALNQIAQKAGISWEWNGSEIEIYRTKVKTFYVAALANAATTGAGGASTGSATGGAASGEADQIKEMVTYIRSMLSPVGKFSIMESSGMVTVRDTPMVLDTVEKSLKELNAVLSKQINVNFEIYEVEMTDEDMAGLDWNIVWKKAFADQSANYLSLSAPTGLNSLSVGVTTGPFTGSTLNIGLKAVNANILNTKSHAIVTKNGKITPIKMQDTTEYVRTLKKDQDEQGRVTYTPEIANGTTGLDSRVQARIQPDGKILLKFDLKIEELKSLRPFVVDGQNIQLADNSKKELSQEITLQSGNSLVMSGIKTSNKKQTAQGIGHPNFWALGGQQGGSRKNTYLIILVTPYMSEN